MPDSVTQILKSGLPGTKLNIATLGDGFDEADQSVYNNKVNELLIDGVFGHDYFYEDMQAFNIYRVNLISTDSGVSQRTYDENGTPTDPSDDSIISTTIKNTALGYIYSGSWAHCWLEGGANTGALLNAALNTWVPDYDLVLVILNESGFGGCGGGGFQRVTLGSSWQVMAHEFGHGAGGLNDEYCKKPLYTGPEKSWTNITTISWPPAVKWKQFVNPITPIPTGIGNCAGYNQGNKRIDWSDSQDVGLFEGGGTYFRGIYRPVINCRMRGNSPPFCPVCYTHLKTKHHAKTSRTFLKCYVGDFNGDGKDDLLIHNDNSVLIYRSNGLQLDLAFSAVGRIPGSWSFKPNDKFFVGDFNYDGKDEVVVYNSTDWIMEYLGLLIGDGDGGLRLIDRYDDAIPSWQFNKNDYFYVGDFNGDGKDDLFVFNGEDWSIPYLGMLQANGTSFSVIRRYDSTMPSWQMRSQDKHYVGDFNGDGKDDLFVFNGEDWSMSYLGMLQSNGNTLAMTKRYDSTMPSWQMRSQDKHYVGDFNGDGKDDLFVFNGEDWSMSYLGMLQSNGNTLAMTKRYDGNVPGWKMRKHDSHYVVDVTGDGKTDLFVYNHHDWAPEYLGTMISTGTSLQASWSEDWVGEWNLGSADRLEQCNYEGVAAKRDLIIHNKNWLGMIRHLPDSKLHLDKMYYKWIHNYRYGRNW